MKLSLIHEAHKNRDALKQALRFIYGHGGRPMGMRRSNLHQPLKAEPVDMANRALGARAYDPGTPWKPRHRRFFRMSNDGAQGTIRY